MRKAYVYLLTIYTRGGLEPFGAYSSEQTARQALHVMKPCQGAIITRLEMNCHYTNGIGEAKHWHVEENLPLGDMIGAEVDAQMADALAAEREKCDARLARNDAINERDMQHEKQKRCAKYEDLISNQNRTIQQLKAQLAAERQESDKRDQIISTQIDQLEQLRAQLAIAQAAMIKK